MSKLNNISMESLSATIEKKNHEFVTDIHGKINIMKGYEAGFVNPKKGALIINKDGTNYLVEVKPILEENLPLLDAIDMYSYLLK